MGEKPKWKADEGIQKGRIKRDIIAVIECIEGRYGGGRVR